MRLTSWNLLHGMAIPPGQSSPTLQEAVRQLASDVIVVQEVDHHLPRSAGVAQMAEVASGIGADHWAFTPAIIGTPGEKWRKLTESDPHIITDSATNSHIETGSYGIGIASKIAVKKWHRLDLGNSPIGMPLLIPGGADGKGRPKFFYVHDEPRVAIAATLENGWTIINTHLSFVPGFNVAQLRKLKRWAFTLGAETNTKVLIAGDLNLPKNLPLLGSKWRSLNTTNTYPSWGAKIQFDYILAHPKMDGKFAARESVQTGLSDHLPLRVILN